MVVVSVALCVGGVDLGFVSVLLVAVSCVAGGVLATWIHEQL